MVEFSELRSAPLSGIDRVAGAFESLVRSWEFSSELTGDVITPLQGSGWRGSAAEQAADGIRKVRTEIDSAFEEASAMALALRDAHTELAGAQADLKAALQSATDQGLTVDDTGGVHWPPATNTADKKDVEYADTYRQKATGVADAIARAVARATAADAAAAAALAADTGTDRTSFNAKPVGGQPEEEAEKAADLLRLGDKATEAQILELNQLVKSHAGDPRFATAFYSSTGPDGFLSSYGALSEFGGYYGSDATKKALLDLQGNLGRTLATATDGAKVPHLSDAWQTGLRKAGAAQYQLLPDRLQGGNPYGYQILSNILRTGTYDPHFLNPVVEHVTQLSAENPGRWEDAVSKANPINQVFFLGKDGSGINPMSGALEALGHNPTAATKYFHDAATVYNDDGTVKATGQPNTYLKQLTGTGFNSVLQDYQPDHFSPHGKAASMEAGALGHALEAATTGRAYDATDAPLPVHTPEMAAVMAQVVDRFGNGDGPGLLGKSGLFAGTSGSLGHITAVYMGDVQAALNPGDNTLPTHGTRAALDQANTEKLLGALGRNPEAYGAIAQAQQAYTTAHIQDVMQHRDQYKDLFGDAVRNAARPGGEVAGILTAARTDEVYVKAQAEADAYNKAIDQNAVWAKTVWAITGGKVLGDIPGVGGGMSYPVNGFIDSIGDSYHIEAHPSDDATVAYDAGKNSAAAAAQAAVEKAGRAAGLEEPYLNTLALSAANETKNGLGDGATLFGRALHG
ncbi:DUF6571 family protein [Kitasatospora sp. NPDC047058]|uniref:DUF6571 family protein n=1 Tax=Kitasatospora sp. NPDC047058 TaxID=3155620 RepID=UPI0033EF43B9